MKKLGIIKQMEKLNLLLALEKPAKWTDLHTFLERQEKKLVDVGHLVVEPSWPKANVTKQMAQTTAVAICGKGNNNSIALKLVIQVQN